MNNVLFAGFKSNHSLVDCFQKDGFETDVKSDPEELEKYILDNRPRIAIVDSSVKTLLLRIREIDRFLPVIVIGKKAASSKIEIEALKNGADAFLRSPVDGEALLAWVHSILSRLENCPFAQERYSFDDIEVDVFKRTVKKKGWTVVMSATEFELLVHFCRSDGRIVSRNEILKEVWKYSTCPTTRTVDNFICKLRRKLEDKVKYLKTVKGTGYLFCTTGV